MITPFPQQRQRRADPLGWALALHSAETAAENEGGLAWVTWLFQSVRAQSTALVFQSNANDRATVIADWQRFAEETFMPVLAPVLLQSWKASGGNDDATLTMLDRGLGQKIPAAFSERSVSAGAMLMAQTRGAKHQGTLGRFRQHFDNGETPGHLAIVWSAVADLFQLPPLDVLTEYLRQEWLVGAGLRWHDDAPGGALCFAGLAQRALHQAGVLAFEK